MNEVVLELPVRLRGGSLHLNIHKFKKLLNIEHGDTVSIRLSDITVVKHPVNTEFDKIVEQRKKVLITQNPIVKERIERRKRLDYEVL